MTTLETIRGLSVEFLLVERKNVLPVVLPAQLDHLPETAQTIKPTEALCIKVQ